MPIRYLETLGMDGAWASVMMNAGAAFAALTWMIIRRTPVLIDSSGLIGAILVGFAATTYSIAFTQTDVVRVILLFYLAPAWGKIIEWAFMGQPWRWTSTLTLAASLSGALLVLGGHLSIAAIGFGDVMALLSGVAWAAGAAMIFTGDRSSPITLSLATAISASLIGLGFIWAGIGTDLSSQITWLATSAGAGFGTIYVLPILALTLWSAQRLSPAVVSFLLTAEILSGVLSSVLFLDEPFGPMRAAGACLIFGAALAEVIPSLRLSPRNT